MLDLIASLMVRLLHLVFTITPMRFNLWLGRRVGALVYLFSGKRKMVAYANLKAAFSPGKSPKELNRIVKDMYINLVQGFAEIVSMTKIDAKYVEKYIDVRNIERIERLSKLPEGVIFISAHFGNWELNAVVSAIKGFPLYFLGREQKMKRLSELINLFRETKGSVVIRKGTDVKTIIRVLHEGKIVGMAGDQNAGMHGQLLDVFGRPGSTAVGPFRIAERTGAYILPAFIHRVKGPYHVLVIEEPMKINKDEDIIPYMEKYNRLLEKHVGAHPEQWLWMHKRWKLTTLKKALVLDDGKKGHLKQSLAVVKQFKRYRSDEGFSPADTPVEVAAVRFKSAFAKGLFNSLVPFLAVWRLGSLWLLKVALQEASYRDLMERYADIIISCGSTLAGVNAVLKLENNARNVTVLDPGRFKRGKFNLIVAPRHDAEKIKIRGKKMKEKVVVTEMAPNLIDPEEIACFRAAADGEGALRLGFLVGGDNPHYAFSDGLLRSLEKGVKEACETGARFYITTSRRTSEAQDRMLSGAFSSHPACLSFVSGREDSDEHTVEKILASSDVVIASGESISMVSEAVSSGKPVLVFMPEKRSPGRTKYEAFVEGLEEKNHLRRVRPDKIADGIQDALARKSELAAPDDDKRIYGKMYRLF